MLQKSGLLPHPNVKHLWTHWIISWKDSQKAQCPPFTPNNQSDKQESVMSLWNQVQRWWNHSSGWDTSTGLALYQHRDYSSLVVSHLGPRLTETDPYLLLPDNILSWKTVLTLPKTQVRVGRVRSTSLESLIQRENKGLAPAVAQSPEYQLVSNWPISILGYSFRKKENIFLI